MLYTSTAHVYQNSVLTLATNFQTRERAKLANSSLDQVDSKMMSEVLIKATLNGSLTA